MKLRRCPNEHYYDGEKYEVCPYCDMSSDGMDSFHKTASDYYGRDMERDEWCTDYEKKCGNCHSYIGDDKYCRCCGTKRGEGAFLPYQNFQGCIYGPPPIRREHKCQSCGYTWVTNLMINDQKYCPECGGRVKTWPDEEENERYKIR